MYFSYVTLAVVLGKAHTNFFHISVLSNENQVFPVLTVFDITTTQQKVVLSEKYAKPGGNSRFK